MTTTPSAQLQAITRLELASDALDKALRAVQHPDLDFAGSAVVAPSGLKHLTRIRASLAAIESAMRPSGSHASNSDASRYDQGRAQLAAATVKAFQAADEALASFEVAQQLLAQLPDEAPPADDDDEIVAFVCSCRTETGEPRMEHLTRAAWRTLVGFCAKCRGQIHEVS